MYHVPNMYFAPGVARPMSKLRNPDLTEGQKACLRLVDEHRTSKEISRILGISHHTVDQRLNLARKKLGADSRIEAARIFAELENISQPLVYQPAAVEPGILGAIPDMPSSREARSGSSGLKTMLTVPPIGGERHSLSKRDVLLKGLGVAFYSSVILTVIIIVLIGAFRLFE